MHVTYQKCLAEYHQIWDEKKSIPVPPMVIGDPLLPLRQTIRFFRLRIKLNRVCKMISKESKLTKASHQNLLTLVSLWLDLDAKAMNQRVIGDYIKTTESFIQRVKNKWPEMDEDSIFQALRNVWIMNLIQVMANNPIELTDAMFAYSMLYPLTDNLMDSTSLSLQDKQTFVMRLGKRLRGEPVNAKDIHESDVFEMIDLIESQYPRSEYTDVYESLLLIHHAQLNSLKQQGLHMTRDELKALTFNKGAASVVADGYLVLGRLSADQMGFLIGYGIVLQLADDLQDMTTDANVHHATLFSSAETNEVRIDTLHKLLHFSNLTLEKLSTEDPHFAYYLKELLSSSMTLLIGDAVYEQRSFFSPAIFKYIESLQIVRLHQHAHLKRIGGKWAKQLNTLFQF